jgi:glycosyltransferase involved in cell wall biosynthesis
MEKILICTNHFYPETFRVNDIAFNFAEKGYDVTVLTAIPDYPKGKYFDGYGIFSRRCEKVKGVKVIRGFAIPRGNGNTFRIVLNYLSFFISSVFISVWLGLFRKFDRVFVHETSPVMIGVPAIIVKKLQHIPLLFWVLDLWPESLQAAGGVNNIRVLKLFEKLTKWIYKNSDKILISSRGFEQSILDKGDFKDKIVYFPNWVDREMASDKQISLPQLPQGFIVMFAGNIGEAQDFEHIMDAAIRLRSHKDIHFVIVGNGRKFKWVESFVQNHSLEEQVHLLGRYPSETMPLLFSKADVMLVTLKDASIFNLTVPAKLQAYMSAGKPIVAMMNGEGPRVIEEAQCGWSVVAGDDKGLAKCILEISSFDEEILLNKGSNGRRYQIDNFNVDKCLLALERMME